MLRITLKSVRGHYLRFRGEGFRFGRHLRFCRVLGRGCFGHRLRFDGLRRERSLDRHLDFCGHWHRLGRLGLDMRCRFRLRRGCPGFGRLGLLARFGETAGHKLACLGMPRQQQLGGIHVGAPP